MKRYYLLDEKLAVLLLIILLFQSFTLPYTHLLNSFVVKLLLSTIIILSVFSFSKLFSFNFLTINIVETLLVTTIFLFLVSNFYINIENNLNFESISTILTYFLLFVSFFIVFSRKIRLEADKFEKFINIFFYSGIILSIISLIFWAMGIHYVSQYAYTSAGLFGHPNTASMFYTIVVPVLFYKYFSKKITFLSFISILILFLLTLLLTYSRAGYIGVGIGILAYTFYRSKVLFFFVTILVAFVATTIVLDFASTKVDSTFSRFLLISTAINVITQDQTSLLWGYGPEKAYQIFGSEKILYGNEPVPNPHNLILLLCMQFGVLFTCLFYLTLIALLVKVAFLRVKTNFFRKDQKLSLSLTIVVSLIIQNLFEDVLGNPKYFFLPVFMVFIGYIYHSIRFEKKLA